jgi:MoxR-like ATPase
MAVVDDAPSLGEAVAGKPFAPTGSGVAHVFVDDEILAVSTAIAAGRALLVRGEPGTGKTQLAKAAALALGRAFVSHTVDSRTEARDVLWHFDAVARLAEAQLMAAGRPARGVEERLSVRNFIQPRALWWAFDWKGAETQAKVSGAPTPELSDGCDPAKGVVVLIDEIDKAESETPNGLLEALGAREFTPQGFDGPVRQAPSINDPLVIITTNDERTLPDAFIRRCLVLHLELPTSREGLIDLLVQRGEAHFPDAPRSFLEMAAEMVADDRDRARLNLWRPYPGVAEYLDLVRAVRVIAPGDLAAQERAFRRVSRFALKKHPDALKAG